MRTHLLLVATNITIGLLFSFLASVSASEYEQKSMNLEQNTAALPFQRKLLVTGNKCSKNDIVIAQSQTESQYNGIPTYLVEITNTCLAGRSISNIHLHCGWFSSSTLINPRTFKRVAYDDCLVNDGKPVAAGLAISFKYTTTFMYPLSVSSFS